MNITSDSGWSGYYCGSTTNGTCGNRTSTGKKAFNAGASLGAYYPGYGSAVLYYGQSNFLASNTYTISYTTYFSAYNNDIEYIKKHAKNFTYIINGYVNSTTGYSDSYIKTYSCSSRWDTTTTNAIITTCTIQLNSNVTRIQIKTNYYEYEDGANIYYLINAMRINNNAVNYSEGIGSQIDNQTIVIENGMQNIEIQIKDGAQSIIDELDKDHTYESNDITDDVNDLEEKEDELMELLDGDMENTLNITIQSQTNNYIWDKITNITWVSSYLRVFYLTLLSLGIIRLVLAR